VVNVEVIRGAVVLPGAEAGEVGTLDWLWVPLRQVQLARQVNWAASGAADSASRASSRASTFTPLSTGRSVMVIGASLDSSWIRCTGAGRHPVSGKPPTWVDPSDGGGAVRPRMLGIRPFGRHE
jgi:hypothetical protein